ncbi:taurine ABC transporter substrate-binding protein [Shinella sp. SUS2]|jgi:taurine transport system substrate-binding protein|uniref:taurine ABC transporter substrate-binding protein n=1 Tax=unclassified Shinella TaxID=2643062 RepID=UPI000559CB2E|nr:MULTISPECIES: taurine ABC transporter substrate-binding protein [unclassified Shinella]KNY15849.1 taurine ABC transporter substrate-binding protein [Shinella sp. SUS2]KOC75756.1 taurine ABC transporter substrate-binding protein [Shinella sp. GWS1]MCA0344541.1 taurine ABC transporter substrate-binding protein [Pseudomonadota bacterium]MDG4672528.1 taurine ABC transporter substrate-binding protein [Shinella sp. 838]
MMLFKHFQRMTATAGLLAGLLASSAAYAETNLVVGYQQIVGPFVAAIADGRFDAAAKEVGYTIDWRQFSSAGDITTALASGDVPIGVLGSTGTAAAATRGVELQLFWILDNIGKSEALVARDGSGIETPADLKGKKVAVPFVSTSHFHLLVGMSKVWNVDPREVEILNLKPPQIVAAWQRGDIDAAYVWPPALSEILKTGKAISDSEVIGAASVPTFDGLVVDKAWAAENPKLMEAFTKVLAESYADYNANKTKWTVDSPEVQGIVKLIGGDGPSTVEALGLLSFPNADEQASDTWLGGGATRALTESAKFLVEQKQIGKSLDDYTPFVNADFAAAAAK